MVYPFMFVVVLFRPAESPHDADFRGRDENSRIGS